VEEMDLDTLTIEKGSHVDTALAENFSDTVYNCRLSGTWIKIALLIMKNIFDQQKLEHHLTQFLEIGRAYFQETQGLKFLEAVINYILQATVIETGKLVQSVACILNQQLIKFRLLLIDKIGGSA
jgi:hypothetical protein